MSLTSKLTLVYVLKEVQISMIIQTTIYTLKAHPRIGVPL